MCFGRPKVLQSREYPSEDEVESDALSSDYDSPSYTSGEAHDRTK